MMRYYYHGDYVRPHLSDARSLKVGLSYLAGSGQVEVINLVRTSEHDKNGKYIGTRCFSHRKVYPH